MMRHEIHELGIGVTWQFCDAFHVSKLDSARNDASLCGSAQNWCTDMQRVYI